MAVSAFGVEHGGIITKGFALGSPEANLASDHRGGQHADLPHNKCTLCKNPRYAPRAIQHMEAGLKAAKAVR